VFAPDPVSSVLLMLPIIGVLFSPEGLLTCFCMLPGLICDSEGRLLLLLVDFEAPWGETWNGFVLRGVLDDGLIGFEVKLLPLFGVRRGGILCVELLGEDGMRSWDEVVVLFVCVYVYVCMCHVCVWS
jgi:hypothetical protein